jgi:hypothetical protein
MRPALLLAILAAACGETRQAPPSVEHDAAIAAAPIDAEAVPVTPPTTEPDEPPAPPPGIEELGAIPAWRAVVERAQYLARRGQRGVIYGRVEGAVPRAPVAGAAPPSGDAGVPLAEPADLVWLVDETQGNGALAARVKFPEKPPAKGDRVAVGGAWVVDEARRWYWLGDQVVPLPADQAPPRGKEPPGPVGHHVGTQRPENGWAGVRIAKHAKDGEILAFTVVKRPPYEGAGWGASDKKWGELMGVVVLPGEQPSYGGHDMRTPDERWHLKMGWTYWVRVGKVRRRQGQIPVIEAVTPPLVFP